MDTRKTGHAGHAACSYCFALKCYGFAQAQLEIYLTKEVSVHDSPLRITDYKVVLNLKKTFMKARDSTLAHWHRASEYDMHQTFLCLVNLLGIHRVSTWECWFCETCSFMRKTETKEGM